MEIKFDNAVEDFLSMRPKMDPKYKEALDTFTEIKRIKKLKSYTQKDERLNQLYGRFIMLVENLRKQN